MQSIFNDLAGIVYKYNKHFITRKALKNPSQKLLKLLLDTHIKQPSKYISTQKTEA